MHSAIFFLFPPAVTHQSTRTPTRVFRNTNGQNQEKIKKKIIKIFKACNLSITVDINLKTVNYLDIHLDLNTGIHNPSTSPTENQTMNRSILTNSPTIHHILSKKYPNQSTKGSPKYLPTKKYSMSH